jgi:hypothetical protein
MTNILGYGVPADFILKFSFKKLNKFENSFSRCPKFQEGKLPCVDNLSFEIDYLDGNKNKINLNKVTELGEAGIKSMKDSVNEFDFIAVKKSDKNLTAIKIKNGYIVNILIEKGFIYIACMIDNKKVETSLVLQDKIIKISPNTKFNKGGGIDKNEINIEL